MSSSVSDHTEDEDANNPIDQLTKLYSCISFDLIETLQKKILTKFNASYEKMPAPLKRRINRLKQLQYKTFRIDAQYQQELYALESKYYQLCASYYQRRSEIITGKYKPTDEECVWEIDDKRKASDDLKSKVTVTEVKDQEMDVDIEPEAQITKIEDDEVGNKLKSMLKGRKTTSKVREYTEQDVKFSGIPGFWLRVFLNCPILDNMINDCDKPILQQLHDIKVKYMQNNQMGFVLEFHFGRNDYFSNPVLTKEYHMRSVIKQNELNDYQGPQIYRTKGCIIDWKSNQNVTIKKTNKKEKSKNGTIRRKAKTDKVKSFFNFFNPPIVNENTLMSEDIEVLLTIHFEVGNYIKDKLVPKAIIYFTGDNLRYEEEALERLDDNLKAHWMRKKTRGPLSRARACY